MSKYVSSDGVALLSDYQNVNEQHLESDNTNDESVVRVYPIREMTGDEHRFNPSHIKNWCCIIC